MTISNQDLLLAILAMDAYNRGYGAGLKNLNTSIGSASLLPTSALPDGSQAAGFFAQAYSLQDGQTVISYRGTDVNFSLGATGSDLLNGYGVGAGSPFGPQARLAVQFYNSVVSQANVTGNLLMTGHSLGGGLAGYVGSLFGNYGDTALN
ncbi:Mbeg1-like protein [Bradyrhizobium sp. WD16]|uniref:Mbeg1-like protein n=1 Tax=Bradyrhizobium sp. WD16 TaxID=1521768 RepID=UPI0020A351AC|nr:Mbeg1-like protein [Bradyrhizobium sp. WD16]